MRTLSITRTLRSIVPKPTLYLGIDTPLLSLMHVLSKRTYISKQGEGFKKFLEPKIKVQAKRFEHHPLLKEWLGRSGLSPIKMLAMMTPLMIEFVMGFKDYNELYLRYPPNKNSTIFESVINSHTIEDASHSLLFLSDWKELGLDAMLEWCCSDYMSSVMTSYDCCMKSQGLKLYFLAYKNPHPFARFALMETIETAGQKFFEQTAGYGKALAESGRGAFNYFGPHHLALESGHMENEHVFFSTDSALLEQATFLSIKYGADFREAPFRDNVESIVSQVGEVFVDTFNTWYEGAQRFANDRHFFKKMYSAEFEGKSYHPGVCEINRHHLFSLANLSRNANIQASIKAISDHALYSSSGLLLPSHNIARIMTPFALIDILGTAFICRFNDWAYCGSSGKHLSTLINLSKAVSGMGDALIHDWKRLNLDDYGVGFDASQIMSFKFFAQRSDLHRKHFALWFCSLLEHKDPVMRCLIIHATVNLYATFISSFASCLHHNVRSHELALFNGRWFDRYNHRFGLVAKALEDGLTAQKSKQLAAVMAGVSKRFLLQLNQASSALKEGDKIEMGSSPAATSFVK